MLLNLLKVRYSDAPVFMDVASVINAYELTGEVSLQGQVAKIGRGDQFVSGGATGRYSDKPTITYQPLAGDKFTRSLMLPIPIPGILSLIQSGYPADLVLRVCVNSINDLQNSYGGRVVRRQAIRSSVNSSQPFENLRPLEGWECWLKKPRTSRRW